MRKDGLTRKNIAFCDRFIAGGLSNPSRAYQEAYPKASLRTAQNNASTLLADTRIKQYIDLAVASLPACEMVNVEYVIKGLRSLAESAKIESNKVRAFELLGRYLHIFKDVEVNNTILTDADYASIRLAIRKPSSAVPEAKLLTESVQDKG